MTVNVHSGPGTSAYASTRYTATVNGVTSYVYGLSRTTGLPSEAWANGASVEMSWVKLTANETVTVAITRLAGAITSAVVYPKNVATATIVGGVLSLSVPTNTRLRVEINGDRANVVHVFSEPLPRTIGTVTDWTAVTARTISSINTGTNVITCGASHGWSAGQRLLIQSTGTLPTVTGTALSSNEAVYVLSPSGADLKIARTAGGTEIDITGAGSGTITLKPADWTTGALYFGTGVHRITRGFKLSAGTRVYIDANAVVIGSFDWRGVTGTGPIIEGPGTLLGDFATSEDVQALSTFSEKVAYAMFLGYDAVTFNYDTEVQGITIARAPFYTDFVAVNRYANVQVVSPWFYECNGLQLCGKSDAERTGSIVDCFSFSGDDNLTLGEQVTDFSITVSGCFLVTMANSNVHLNYWSQPDLGSTSTFSNIDMLHLGIADNPEGGTFPEFGGNCHIKCWSDGYIGNEDYGRFNVTFSDIRLWGPHASRWLMLANEDYPFDDYDDAVSRDQRGQIANFVFDGVTIEEEPGQLAIITGFDWENTPHDIGFRGVTFGDVLMTPANFFDYFTTNAYPFRILVGGKPVTTAVDICNRALDLLGHSKRITSIGTPFESTEAEECAMHYDQCRTELLEAHQWNFATVKRELVALDESDDPAFEFAYEMPDEVLEVIAVQHAEAAADGFAAEQAIPQDFKIHADADDVVRIYSDLEDAWCRYTKYVTNPNLFSPHFLNAMTWLLASRLAGPIIKGAEGAAERNRCLQMYALAMAAATKTDARQQRKATEATQRGASWQRK